MPKYKVGDILKSGNDKRKILAVCGEAYLPSMSNDFDRADKQWWTEKDLENCYYTLSQPAQWVPEIGKEYFYLSDLGGAEKDVWKNDIGDRFRLSIGNVFELNNFGKVTDFQLRLQAWAKGERE